MKLSVVVSTLNDREQLLPCLDALSDRLPSTSEVVVVNGPSSDGTTGAVRARDDVDVLVEISERNPNVSRNAGIEVASGDVVAFVGDEYRVSPSWYDAVDATFEAGSDVVTGPVTGFGSADADAKRPRSVAGRSVTYFDGENVAFDRTVLEALDGFDESLPIDGTRDCAHRLAALEFTVTWCEEMAVRGEVDADGGRTNADWGETYRARAYGLAKNYGPRPSVLVNPLGSALQDGVANARALIGGEATPTACVRNGAAVAANTLYGLKDGLRARYADRTSRRNPAGLSSRHDRAVQVYDRR